MLVAVGRLATALIALATIRAVTSYLTPAQYGELALLLTVQMFCGLFLINPIGQHINLHTHAWWDEGTLSARLGSYQKYILVVSTLGSFAVLGMSKQDSAEHLLVAAAAMVAMIIAGTWNATLIPMLNMLGFRAASVFWGIVTAVVSLGSSIFLVVWLPSATAWFAGQAVGMALGALGAKYVFQRHAIQQSRIASRGSAPALIDRQTILAYCLPLAMATGLMWLQQSGYRFVVEHYWGMAQLGFLVAGLQLAGQISLLVESLATQFFYPMFYRRCSDHMDIDAIASAYYDLINTLLPVYLLTAGLIAATSQYLLYLLAAPQYQDSVAFLMVGAGIELCRLVGNLLSNAAHVTRKSISLAIPYGVGAFTALTLLVIVGTKQANFLWTGYSLMIGAAAMMISMWVMTSRLLKIRTDWLRMLGTFSAVTALYLLTYYSPAIVDIRSSLTWLGLNGFLVLAMALALLWKNPATTRMLNVRLENK
jgi:O-antigen/teichoic acid export membrane protein